MEKFFKEDNTYQSFKQSKQEQDDSDSGEDFDYGEEELEEDGV